MAVAQVAVEISVLSEAAAPGSPSRSTPTPPADNLESAFLSACTSAASPAACTTDPGAGPSPVALAIVEWRGAEHARIEVAGTAAGSPRWVRQLEFLPGDAAEERWKAAGYTAGTLARELLAGSPGEPVGAAIPAPRGEGHTEPGKAGTGSPTPERRRTDAHDDEEEASMRVPEDVTATTPPDGTWLDAGAWGGRGLWRNTLRLGGFARFSQAFDGPLVTASIGYATDGPDTQGMSGIWLIPSVGAGYALPLAPRLTVSLRGEIVAERLSITAREAVTGRTDDASRWVGGARAGADLGFVAVGPLGLVLGADGTLRASRTHLELRNEVVGTMPLLDCSVSLGLRAALP